MDPLKVKLCLFSLIVSLVPLLVSSDDDPYRHFAELEPSGKFHLEWTADWTTRRVIFNVTVRTTGYIGFGVTATGKMSGADLVMGGVDAFGEPYLYDMHVPAGTRRPIKDASQDYELHSAWENGTHTSLSFSRSIDTCDSDDYKISDDTIRFIWAFGENDDVTKYHYANRGDYQTFLLDPHYAPRVIQEAIQKRVQLPRSELGELDVWTLRRTRIIPKQDTAYYCSMHKGPSFRKKHHLVGFNFRWVNNITYVHTHHMLLTRCRAPPGVDPVKFFEPWVTNRDEICFFSSDRENTKMPMPYCRDMVYDYASAGANMYFMPDHTGIPVGEVPDEYFLLQVHYDNPAQRDDLLLDINIDMYYTPHLKKYDAGVMTIGHNVPGTPSLIVPPNSLEHIIYGQCGSTCTNHMFPKEGIKIVGVHQHTHYSGIRHRFRHFRGNVELPWILEDKNYDSTFQPTRMLRNEVTVLPGDHLISACTYDTSWSNGNTVTGGFTTRQEMCVVYFWYYSRIADYSLCRSEIVSEDYNMKYLGVRNFTWNQALLENVVAEPSTLRGMPISQVSTETVEWTTAKRQELQKDHRNLPYVEYCNNWYEWAAYGRAQQGIVQFPRNPREYTPNDQTGKCRKDSFRSVTQNTQRRPTWSRFNKF